MNIYIVMSIGGLLGIALHLMVTMQTINKNTSGVGFRDVWKQYWKTDYLSFTISVLSFMVLLFVMSEWIDLNNLDSPDLKEGYADRLLHSRLSTFIKTTSVIAGYFSDYLIYKFIGKTKKVIDQKLDDEKP